MTFDPNRTCCFTGHRKIDGIMLPGLVEKLNLEIDWMASHGIENFIAGGALGFDTIAALTVLSNRQHGKNIKLHLMLPCPDQADRWKPNEIAVYRDIIERADSYEYLCDHYHGGVMHIRNRAMVDASNYCICYWDNTVCGDAGGGTLYTVNYARKSGRRIINLHDEPPTDGQIEFDFC